MKYLLFTKINFFMLILLLPYPAKPNSNFSIEIGPSYVFNLSGKEWKNAYAFNLGMNYELNQRTFINMKFTFQNFPLNEHFTFISSESIDKVLGWTIRKEDTQIYDISLALRIHSNENFIIPIFHFRTGIHFIDFGYRYRSVHLDSPYFRKTKQDNDELEIVGYAEAGFGISITILNNIRAIIDTAFSVSFDYSYIFIPVNLSVQYTF